MSELTCHLEKQGWGANSSIEIFQLNQHWNQKPHFIFAIIEVQCSFHPIHANPKLDIWKARICFLRSKVRGQLTRLALAKWCVPESPLYSTLSIALWVQCVEIILECFQCFSSPVNFAFGTSILPVCFFSSFNFVFGTEINLLTWIMVSTSIYSHLPTMLLNHSHRRCWLDLQENQMNCFYVSSSTCIHHTWNHFYSFILSSSILNLVFLFWVNFTVSLHCLQKLTLYPL